MKTKILKISAVILSVVIILSMFTSCNDVIRGAWEIYGLVFNELEDGTYSVKVSGEGILPYLFVPSTYNGKSVTMFKAKMYSGDYFIKRIVLPNSITYIESGAFKEFHALESINIPNKVTEIGMDTFSLCYSLEEITIPASITYIHQDAFNYCPNLKTVKYSGTEEQWRAISKDDSDFANCTVIYNYTK